MSDKLQFVAQSDKLKHVGHQLPKKAAQADSLSGEDSSGLGR